jgi:hypothetical protein
VFGSLTVAGAVDENPPDPRQEAIGISKLGQLSPGGQECVLGNVFGTIGSGDDEREPMEIGEMDVDQLIECLTVAPRCTRDEIQVVPPSCSVIQTAARAKSFGRSSPR